MFRALHTHVIARNSLARFLLVGIANTCVGLSVIWSAKEVLGASDAESNLAGYVVGLIVSFFLNKRWSFSFSGDAGAALLRFLLVFAAAYAANLLLVLTAIAVSGSHSFWLQLLGMPVYLGFFYLGCRWYAFPVASEVKHTS